MHHYVLLINKLMHPFNFSLYFEFFFLKKNGQWVKNEWNHNNVICFKKKVSKV